MKRLFALTIIIAALLSACSPIGEDLMPGAPEETPAISTPTLNCNFKGIWTVNGIMADTLEVEAFTKPSECYLAFYGFPYKTIAGQALPDVKVAKITTSLPLGVILSAEERLLLETIVNHDGNNCIEAYKSIPYRCIGISDNTIYLEMKIGTTYGAMYIPFVVTKDDGTIIAVVLTVAATESIALLERNGASFSSILTMTQIETIIDGQTESKTLSPAMQLKFTSTERIK